MCRSINPEIVFSSPHWNYDQGEEMTTKKELEDYSMRAGKQI